RGVPIQTESVARSDLEGALLKLQPKPIDGAPWRLSDRLLVFPLLFFGSSGRWRPLRSVVMPLKEHHLQVFLTGKTDVPSVFERFGVTERNGDPIWVTSHMFRHWLATLALSREISG